MPIVIFNKFLNFLGVVLRMGGCIVGLRVKPALVAAVPIRIRIFLPPGHVLLIQFYELLSCHLLVGRDLVHVRKRKLVFSFLYFVYSFLRALTSIHFALVLDQFL